MGSSPSLGVCIYCIIFIKTGVGNADVCHPSRDVRVNTAAAWCELENGHAVAQRNLSSICAQVKREGQKGAFSPDVTDARNGTNRLCGAEALEPSGSKP